MKLKLVAVALVFLALIALLVNQGRRGDAATREVRDQLSTMLKASKPPAALAAGDDSIAILTRRFYKKRGYAPAWTRIKPLPRAKELVEVLENAHTEGLDPDDYGTTLIRQRAKDVDHFGRGPDPAVIADLELRLTAAFLRYGSDLFDGRVDPRRLPTEWRTRPRRTSMLAKLQNAVDRDRVRETLARYRAIAEKGGWPVVPLGPALARGQSGPRVAALRARLAVTGDLPSGAANGRVYDATLENAVKAFQSRLGLDVTGRVGPADLSALNYPAEGRIRQIEINMERWRWLPDKLGDPVILVNIPDFMLHVSEHDRPVMDMRVVVGKAVDHTPVFSDEISYVVFGPSWNIPQRIVNEEILPAVDKDPDYLAQRNIRVFDGPGPDAHEVRSGWFSWLWGSDPKNYSYRQDPGPDNPLGRVKFMCPNQFDVYLHDTPADHLFQQRLRTFSHGCIRVERPEELANYLLRGKREWTPERIAAAMDSAREEVVGLPKPVAVHILYWTAWVDDSGRLQLRPDYYGLDAIVAGALRRHDRAVADQLSRL
jgi:L,D-transpeptidase YcbB